MILCNLRWQQQLAGVSFHIWEKPHIKINQLLESGWITTGMRTALAATNCRITFTKDRVTGLMLLPLAGDVFIMDQMIKHIDGVHLYRIHAC
jgi:hypothetical protein